MSMPHPLLAAVACALFISVLERTGAGQATDPGSPNTLSVDEQFVSPAATIRDMAWIAGSWRGQALGGEFEETWNPPLGDSMIGTFRLVIDGKTEFSEHMALIPQGNSLVIRLKHFDGQLKGWEEKDKSVDFRLVKIEDRTAYFNGLTFRLKSPDTIEIFVRMKSNSGKISELHFPANRASLDSAE